MRVFKFSSARVRFSLLPRDGVVLLFSYCAARVRLSLLPRDGVLLSFRCYAARVRLSLLPRDGVVRVFKFSSARVRLFSPTPCHSERSRGISWKRTRRLVIILAFPKRRGKVDCAKNERKTDRGLIFDIYVYPHLSKGNCFRERNCNNPLWSLRDTLSATLERARRI